MKTSNRIEEYRVGNYVACDKSGYLGEIIQIKSDVGGYEVVIEACNHYNDRFTTTLDVSSIRPIPLTEDLIECVLTDDFSRKDFDSRPIEFEIPYKVLPDVWIARDWKLTKRGDKNNWWISFGLGHFITEVMSLHHLQNIFYDLEGKELSIRERRLKQFIKTKDNEKE